MRGLFSEGWKKQGQSFQSLEEIVPRVGNFQLQLSEHWKIRDGFFQSLEKIPCPRQGRPKAGPRSGCLSEASLSKRGEEILPGVNGSGDGTP